MRIIGQNYITFYSYQYYPVIHNMILNFTTRRNVLVNLFLIKLICIHKDS